MQSIYTLLVFLPILSRASLNNWIWAKGKATDATSTTSTTTEPVLVVDSDSAALSEPISSWVTLSGGALDTPRSGGSVGSSDDTAFWYPEDTKESLDLKPVRAWPPIIIYSSALTGVHYGMANMHRRGGAALSHSFVMGTWTPPVTKLAESKELSEIEELD